MIILGRSVGRFLFSRVLLQECGFETFFFACSESTKVPSTLFCFSPQVKSTRATAGAAAAAAAGVKNVFRLLMS